MAAKIDVYRDHYSYGLAWFDEDGEGLRFGEDAEVEQLSRPPADRELAEHWHAYEAARKIAGCNPTQRGALLWESMAQATAARAAARAAVKVAASEVPWPEWAKLALAAGWKAPRGWNP